MDPVPAPEAEITPTRQPETDEEKDKKKAADERERGIAVMERARKRFEYIVSIEGDTRTKENEDLRFVWVPGAQWNDQIRQQRTGTSGRSERPCLEFDQTRQYVKRIVNEIRQSRPQISIKPEGNGASKKTAQLRSGLARKIQYASNAERVYDAGVELACTSGRGYWRIVTEYESETSFNQVLRIVSIRNSGNVYLDPDVEDPLDRRWGFVCEYLDKTTYEAEWPGKPAVSWDEGGGRWGPWWDGEKVCVADYYEIVED